MIHSICKEHDWVEVFTYLDMRVIATNYQCRFCGIFKRNPSLKIPENIDIANENIFNAEKFYENK